MCGASLLMAAFLLRRRQCPSDSLIHLLGDICSNATLANAVEVKPWLILCGAFVSDQQLQP